MRGILAIAAIAAIGLWGWGAPVQASHHLGFEPQGSGQFSPANSDGVSSEEPRIRARALGGSTIELDGKLDDPAWRDAEAGRGFRQWDPDRGAEASQPTVFKVLYDDEAIYFGIACYESEPDNIVSTLSRRDRIDDSDVVSVYIDPYLDRNTGYNFRVNPHGVVEDAYLYDDGNGRDRDWDAVWEAKTQRDESGWSVEMRIPFSSVRFRRSESMVWGLQVYRYMHRQGQDTAWYCWDRDTAGFISRFGLLTDMQGIASPRQLEVVPYVVSRTGNPGDPHSGSIYGESWDYLGNVGADLKYGLSSNLSLNATIQPDFGQVEADPAQLNLSPFETFYGEKRPFFIEGSRQFQHPHFNLFYSRRIGTGSQYSRIRFASKLIGKTAGDISVAALVAATDEANEGQVHNPFITGAEQTWYGVGRFGKEFAGGKHRLNFMQTLVKRNMTRSLADDRPWVQRDAYSTGMDFDLNFLDRRLNLNGSYVHTIVDPAPVIDDPTVKHTPSIGTGGAFGINKRGGAWRAGASGSWESDKLDPNDIGFLSAPDEVTSRAYLRYHYNSDGEESLINQGNQEISVRKTWLYAGRSVEDPANPGEALWSYEPGQVQMEQLQANAWWQLRNFWSFWYGLWYTPDGLSRTATRDWDEGPLIIEPEGYGGWLGFNTDWRKSLSFELGVDGIYETRGTYTVSTDVYLSWVQSSAFKHTLSCGYGKREDNQWVGNFQASDANGDPDYLAGIGGVHYVFGMIDQNTYDITLRSNYLFSPDVSLELYVQPYLTTGSYRDARELAAPATYDLQPFAAEGFEVSDYDFSYGSVNLNLVYRWQYRPGSTLYMVWTHSRGSYDQRDFHEQRQDFSNHFTTRPLFDNEPENIFLVKMNYWFAL